jgi:hypothetical protein
MSFSVRAFAASVLVVAALVGVSTAAAAPGCAPTASGGPTTVQPADLTWG